MALLDLLGRTWALGILWNLGNHGPHGDGADHPAHKCCTFRALQSRCEQISPSLLNARLKELRTLRLVRHEAQGYGLTDMGEELMALVVQLGPWSLRWAEALNKEEEDAT